MESKPRQDLPPDQAMRKRARNAGIVGVGALSAMGMYSVAQAAAERPVEPIKQTISAEDIHTHRNDMVPEVQKSVEVEAKTQEAAQWWPTEVKTNWLSIQTKAREYNIDPYLVATIVAEESMGKNVQNPSGATGLMQIMPSTAQEIARLRHRTYYNMADIDQNLDFGCWLINYLDEKYIDSRGVELESDFGIAMLGVYYGDGEGTGELWVKNGYSPQFLSIQAQNVIPMWQSMYHDKQNPTSEVFRSKRGS